MKFIYKPFSILAKSVGTRLGKSAFDTVWERVGDSEEPPSPTAGRVSLARVAASAALEAATMAAVGAAIEQLTARGFHRLIGAWPEKAPEAEQQALPR
ncbi:MAG TPA: DUF4235 domain-containing protein [Solirubrobacteraceae bacterium]|nr:DUF4235 domain-containing protein [Solirubrobacteraceae bacterium]